MKSRALAFDPGTRNFGYCVLERGKTGYVPLVCGQLTNTVSNLTQNAFMDQRKAYRKEVRALVEQYQPLELFVAERFMTRGILGTQIECVATMIDSAIGICLKHKADVVLTPAVTWKNAVNRALGATKENKKPLDEIYKLTCVTPHQFDAYLLALYFSCKQHSDDFQKALKKATSKKALRALEKVSKHKLINRPHLFVR